jgi:hypothetical protein
MKKIIIVFSLAFFLLSCIEKEEDNDDQIVIEDEDDDNYIYIEGSPQIKNYRLLVGSNYDDYPDNLVEKNTFRSGEYIYLEFTATDSEMDIEEICFSEIKYEGFSDGWLIINSPYFETLPIQESIGQIYILFINDRILATGTWKITFYLIDKQGYKSNKINFTVTRR